MKTAILLVTHKCNQNCSFCLNEWRTNGIINGLSDELSFDDWMGVIKKLKKQGFTNLVFSGGEPLLFPKLSKLIEFAKNLGFLISIQTNGLFITNEFLDCVKNNVESIQISLEGLVLQHNELTNSKSFNLVIESIKKVIKNNIPVITNFTITKKNINCIVEYIALLNNLGVNQINLTRLYKAGSAKINWNTLLPSKYEFIKFLEIVEGVEGNKVNSIINLQGPVPLCLLAKNNINLKNITLCGAAIDEIAIQPNGKITACPSDTMEIGNVKKIPIFNDFLTKVKERQDAPALCKNCSAFELCSGGCRLCTNGTCDVYKEEFKSQGVVKKSLKIS